MARSFNISTEPEPPSQRPAPGRPGPKKPAGGESLAGIEVTPPIIAAAVLVVVLLMVGLFLWRPGALGAAATPMMDTGTQTMAPGDPAKHANGLDSSTESPGPPSSNNGMDTSTGH